MAQYITLYRLESLGLVFVVTFGTKLILSSLCWNPFSFRRAALQLALIRPRLYPIPLAHFLWLLHSICPAFRQMMLPCTLCQDLSEHFTSPPFGPLQFAACQLYAAPIRGRVQITYRVLGFSFLFPLRSGGKFDKYCRQS